MRTSTGDVREQRILAAATTADGDFSAFYHANHAKQVKRALSLCRSADAAADVVHEAFVDVYRNWDRLENPEAYLGRAVISRCRDDGRQASARDRLRLRLLAEPRRPVDELTSRDEQLWQALQELPFNHRAVIALRFYLGHSEAEIAELLGCPQGSVGPWIKRGLASLRTSLERR
ncbi:MAG: sigma-70 family RNA polymerase sigma factor [Actinomycetota bacterium]